jgi:heme oxygenase (mycobilin-producing)
MTIIRINAITVPDGKGEELERRFASRGGEVDGMEGFEGFELLRPTDGTNRYFVMTRWRDEASFLAWTSSPAFGRQHARAAAPDGQPVASHAELLSFEVVEFS